MHVKSLTAEILVRAAGSARFITAICGPPGAGKSTLAAAVANELAKEGQSAVVVPMDGFHLDDEILVDRGLRAKKGAPETFDAAGFSATMQRIGDRFEDVYIPVFDRSLELSRAAARLVASSDRLILVEGNYLLLDQPPWSGLKPLFDFTILLKVDAQELERRSIARWLHHGYRSSEAGEKTQNNDMTNARTVIKNSTRPDIVLVNQENPNVI